MAFLYITGQELRKNSGLTLLVWEFFYYYFSPRSAKTLYQYLISILLQ